MEKIRCKVCGSVGYSASADVQCSNCGNRENEVLSMDRVNIRKYNNATIHYLQGLAVGSDKPGTFCRD